ncbi:MAG: hypothetical protein ABI680_04150, partial [Chthoniobacteraceae bacterium]
MNNALHFRFLAAIGFLALSMVARAAPVDLAKYQATSGINVSADGEKLRFSRKRAQRKALPRSHCNRRRKRVRLAHGCLRQLGGRKNVLDARRTKRLVRRVPAAQRWHQSHKFVTPHHR